MVQRENNSWDMYRYMYVSNETCYSVYVSYFSFLFIDNLMDNLLFSSISVIISRRREYFYFVHRFFLTFLQIGDSYFSIAFLELFYLDLIAFLFFFLQLFFLFFFLYEYQNIDVSHWENVDFSFHVESCQSRAVLKFYDVCSRGYNTL